MTVTAERGSDLIGPVELARELGLAVPTPEQVAVIAAPVEPALVIAGAGAGKTETMAARVVWLVANGIVAPERVLGLTFTRKAAGQLGDRVRARLRRLAASPLLDRLDPGGQRRAALLACDPTVLTYHAYAGRLVAEHGLRVPVEPGARPLTETAAWQLAHRVVSTWTEDIDTDKVPATITNLVLDLSGELAEHLVDPDDLVRWTTRFLDAVENAPRAARQRAGLPKDLQRILATQRLRVALLPLLADYARRKRRAGAVDFADQMSLAARLATDHPEVVSGERSRFGAVLLDEYQDTGHAQRVLLRALFGGAAPMPVTAVGDPVQAIYGWRGASAANLPRFASDFPRLDQHGGAGPARQHHLLTSFRNPPEVLDLANAISEPLRGGASSAGPRNGTDADGALPALRVPRLRPRADAGPGAVSVALTEDVRAEREWVANRIGEEWERSVAETGAPPTAAVLVRRRADMAGIAAALRARGLPVEVVGLGGLLDEPEVRELVSALRVLVDPLAGTSAARLLTGSRWRLGAADLAALWRRARSLGGEQATAGTATASSGAGAEDGSDGSRREGDAGDGGPSLVGAAESAERTGLVDAVDDPGPPGQYSREGYRRIRGFGSELAALRRRLDQPLPDLVADVERTLLLDIEGLARLDRAGRAHLDAFAGVVAEFASASPSATLPSLIDYLRTAEHAEDGLEPGEIEVAEDRVQVVTAHSAKGLEWEVVAVPHLVRTVFPGARRSTSWLGSVSELPAELRGDAADLPRLALAGCSDRKQVAEELARHAEEFEERRLTEERRLCYVALTRSERVLLVSGHWWGETGAAPRGPSEFLEEVLAAVVGDGRAGGDSPVGVYPGGRVEGWAPPPERDDVNPLTSEGRTDVWPSDPLGDRRPVVAAGAELVRRKMGSFRRAGHASIGEDGRAGPPASRIDPVHDPEGWHRDVRVLLAERAAAGTRREEVRLPGQLSVSQLVELAADPEELAARLRRPLPRKPDRHARRGTTFHEWLEQRFGATRLLDVDDLPGASDEELLETGLEDLQAAFLDSDWAARTPAEVEVPFETTVDGVVVRGRMDAVFADEDGGWTVVDWKTGRAPAPDRVPALAVQLAAYRLAWAALTGSPLDRVRAAFHFVPENRTLRPADLLDVDGLRDLVRKIPSSGDT
ncbi:ATP-dependent helicase [Actinoalloteichus caeruleus]|uniref:ATP-dependent helicase n=1 Tax=Actinoalloteichus cyanogriseus TaxID=2893586 RepID=UPI003AAD1150